MKSRTPLFSLFAAALLAGPITASAQVDDGVADLFYDPATGAVSIERVYAGFFFNLSGGPFRTEAFVPTDVLVPLINSSDFLSGLVYRDGPEPTVPIGNVLDPGLDLAGVQAVISPFSTINGQPINPIVIPEPTSLSLLALGGLAVMRRRRGIA